jgi:uncharacterized membrane protein YphA (DoxX/SURF4 family)
MALNFGLLVIRAVVGLTLAAHGSQKLLGWFAIGWHQTSWVWGFAALVVGVAAGAGTLAVRSRNLRAASQAS